MKICCVISSLTTGGAERVMATMTNYWAAKGYGVTLVTVSGKDTDFYPLRPEIRRVGLDLRVNSASPVSAVSNNWKRVRGLRHQIKALDPDVVISFLNRTNVLTVLATSGLDVPVIISERVHPGSHAIGPVWSGLRTLTYRRAQAIVVQSPVTREWAERIAGSGEVKVIPNAIDERFLSTKTAMPERQHTVVGMGRLDPQKGFDVLIEAFARVADRHPDWSLIILGDGDQAQELAALAADRLREDAVRFCGAVDDPERYLQAAGLFVLSSRYEGFPNALLEAMACGCAVISTDCPTGPAEIIDSGVDGILVPPDDVDALARELDRLMGDKEQRSSMGERAARVSDRYSLDGFMDEWESLIDRLTTNGSVA